MDGTEQRRKKVCDSLAEQVAFYRKNKVIGKFAPHFGNQQHNMSIRQARILYEIIRKEVRLFRRWCEVGVHFGNVTCFLTSRRRLQLAVMVDTWRTYAMERPWMPISIDKTRFVTQELHDQVFACAAEAAAEFGDRVVLVRADSAVLGAMLRPNLFDVVFLDADHTYEAVKADIEHYWPTVRRRGILLGDNYETRTAPYWGVKRAADEIFGDAVHKRGRFWWVRKS
jgi:hypothetical protein